MLSPPLAKRPDAAVGLCVSFGLAGGSWVNPEVEGSCLGNGWDDRGNVSQGMCWCSCCMRENCSSNYGKRLGNGFSPVRGEERSLYVVLDGTAQEEHSESCRWDCL